MKASVIALSVSCGVHCLMSERRNRKPDIRMAQVKSTSQHRVQDTSPDDCHQCAAWIKDSSGVTTDFDRSSLPKKTSQLRTPSVPINRVCWSMQRRLVLTRSPCDQSPFPADHEKIKCSHDSLRLSLEQCVVSAITRYQHSSGNHFRISCERGKSAVPCGSRSTTPPG